MDFHLSEEQTLLRDSARRLLEDVCVFEQRAPLLAAGSFDAARWQTYADMGWLAMSVPEALGGLGSGAVESAILMEEVGRVLCVEPLWAIGVLSAQLLTALPGVPAAGQLLTGLMSAEVRPVLAHAEAGARGVLSHVETRAEPAGPGRWRLHGEKPLVVGGNVADRFLISARHSGACRSQDGISLFIVEPQARGLRSQALRLIDNRWCAHLVLDGVEVSEAALLSPLGAAYPALSQAHAHAMIGLGAEAIGLMERALWITRDYLKMRQQFGQVLGSFQVLQHRMSDMLVELELSRGMVYRAISYINAEADVRDAALSSMRVQVGRSGRFVCAQAIQLHGGIGVTEDYIIGHYFKRMTMIENTLGSTHVHLEHLAERERQLG